MATTGTGLHERLIEALGTRGVLTSPEDLSAYAFDAFVEGELPAAVVLPTDARQVSAIVRIARECGRPRRHRDLVRAHESPARTR